MVSRLDILNSNCRFELLARTPRVESLRRAATTDTKRQRENEIEIEIDGESEIEVDGESEAESERSGSRARARTRARSRSRSRASASEGYRTIARQSDPPWCLSCGVFVCTSSVTHSIIASTNRVIVGTFFLRLIVPVHLKGLFQWTASLSVGRVIETL